MPLLHLILQPPKITLGLTILGKDCILLMPCIYFGSQAWHNTTFYVMIIEY